MTAWHLQYIPRNMHTVFALLCFVVVIHWLIFPYPPGLLHWHCGNLTIAPVPAKQPWWIWINTSCEFIMNDCITTTKQSTTKPCAYFLGYTVTGMFSNVLEKYGSSFVLNNSGRKPTIVNTVVHLTLYEIWHYCFEHRKYYDMVLYAVILYCLITFNTGRLMNNSNIISWACWSINTMQYHTIQHAPEQNKAMRLCETQQK